MHYDALRRTAFDAGAFLAVAAEARFLGGFSAAIFGPVTFLAGFVRLDWLASMLA